MNEITPAIPNVHETIERIDIKTIHNQQEPDVDTIPETIRDLLSSPPLLDHENEEEFLRLFESFRAYAEPEDIVDYHLVFNATVCKWETVRYRFMATAATSNQQQAGLESLFRVTNAVASIPGVEAAVKIDAAKNTWRCLTDPVFREKSYCQFESLGYTPDGQAFLLSLPALAAIERLAASAEKRYAASIKELEKRRADRAAKRRLALAQAINGNAKEVNTA